MLHVCFDRILPKDLRTGPEPVSVEGQTPRAAFEKTKLWSVGQTLRVAFVDGTAGFWHAPTRFTDGFELTGAPETGINVDSVPGPRGPVTYRDLWLRQYRIIGDGTQRR